MQMDDIEKLMADEYAKFADKWMKDDGKVNILVAGVTGSGKSTLVNAFFGEALARVDVDGPVTQGLEEYAPAGKPYRVYDTRGFEAGDDAATSQVDRALRRLMDNPDTNGRLHIVWLCLDQATARLEPAHQRFVELARALGVPVIAVVTRSTDARGAFEGKLEELLEPSVPVINVLAIAKPTRAGEIAAYGVADDLLNATLRLAPADRRAAIIAGQMVSWKLKDEEAKTRISRAAVAAGVASVSPAAAVPGGQLIALGAIQAGLMMKLDALAGLPTMGMMVAAKAAGLAMARSGGLKVFQLGVAQVLKLIPGIGTAAGMVLGASVAGSTTLMIGRAYWLVASKAGRTGAAFSEKDFADAMAKQPKPDDVELAAA